MSICGRRGIKMIFAVPGIVVATVFCDISVLYRGRSSGALHTWYRRGGSGCTDGSKRIYDSGKLPSHISNGHCFTESCSVRQERWESLVRYLFCPVTFREKQITMPLYIELLYQGYDFTGAFAVSAILVCMAVVILVLRSVLEHKGKEA